MTKTTDNKVLTNGRVYKLNPEFVNSIYSRKETARNNWTVEEIKNLLKTDDLFVIRSLLKLYSYQTYEEKQSGETKMDNGVGFNGADAVRLSSISRNTLKTYTIGVGMVNFVRTKIMKYAKQLTRIANGQVSIKEG